MIVSEVKPFSEVPPLPQDVEARIAVYQKQQELLQQEVAHRHSDRVQANANAVHSSAAAVDVIFDYYRRELPDWSDVLERGHAGEVSSVATGEHVSPADKTQWLRRFGKFICRPFTHRQH